MGKLVCLALLIASLQGLILSVHGEQQCAGKCVSLSECKSSDFGGDNFFDLRVGLDEEVQSDCDHYLQVCCNDEDVERDSKDVVTEANAVPNHVRAKPEFAECGKRNIGGAGFKISSKTTESEFGEFPWMVAISSENFDLSGETERKYICGGSLIEPNVVLTVAHCVTNRTANTIFVRAGEWDSRTDLEVHAHQERRVSNVLINPFFNQAFMFNNIALLFLDKPFEADEHIQLACLPPQDTVFDDHNCITTGWGKHNFYSDNYQSILKSVEMPIVGNAACQTALRTTRLGNKFSLHNSFLCAGGEAGVDACTGDGGSPLVCPMADDPNRYVQAGMVAWGVGCGQEGIPGVYTKISLYADWINREIELYGLAKEQEDYINT